MKPWVTQVARGTPFDNSTNGFTSTDVQNAIEEAKNASSFGSLAILPVFLNNGSTRNKWLSLYNAFNTSDTLPAIAPFTSEIFALTYTNATSGSNVDIEIYKNGAAGGNLIFTWQIRNKKNAYKTNMTPLALSPGDTISVFCRDVSSPYPNTVVVTVGVRTTASTTGEGGNA